MKQNDNMSIQSNKENPAIMGGSKPEGGAAKETTHNDTGHTEETRRGARRQQRTERERTHTH